MKSYTKQFRIIHMIDEKYPSLKVFFSTHFFFHFTKICIYYVKLKLDIDIIYQIYNN